MYVVLVLISMIVGKSGSREISSLLVRAILPGFFFFFSCVGKAPPAANVPWGYLFGKNYIQN